MGIVLTFILNAALNLVLGLAVAAVLEGDEFGRFAIASVLAAMLASGLFEWLRLATTRFYGEAVRGSDPGVRATLDIGYHATGFALAAVALALVVFDLDFGMAPALAAAACVAGVAGGLFEFKAALARARFLNRTYGTLVIAKNVATLTLMVGAGYFFHTALAVLASLTLAQALSLLPVDRALRDADAGPRQFDPVRLAAFARYGVPIVAGNVIYQLILLANRSSAASAFGFAGSGQLSLATDLSLRLFLSAGAALDVLLFQMAVQADAVEGRAAAHRQIARNMLVVAGVLTPLLLGYAACLPAFEALVVPARFHGSFAAFSLILAPGIYAFCLAQFAFSPVFQLAGRTLPLVLAALVSLGCDAAGLALVPKSAGLAGIAWVHSGSLAIGCLATALMALQTRVCRPPRRALAEIALAGALMLAAVWPMRAISMPWLALAASGITGAGVYGAVLLAFDTAGVRQWLRGRVRAWRGQRQRLAAEAPGN